MHPRRPSARCHPKTTLRPIHQAQWAVIDWIAWRPVSLAVIDHMSTINLCDWRPSPAYQLLTNRCAQPRRHRRLTYHPRARCSLPSTPAVDRMERVCRPTRLQQGSAERWGSGSQAGIGHSPRLPSDRSLLDHMHPMHRTDSQTEATAWRYLRNEESQPLPSGNCCMMRAGLRSPD